PSTTMRRARMSTGQLEVNGRAPSRGSPIGTVVVTVLAAFFYVGMIVCLADAQQRAILLQPRQRLLRARSIRPCDRRLQRGHSPQRGIQRGLGQPGQRLIFQGRYGAGVTRLRRSDRAQPRQDKRLQQPRQRVRPQRRVRPGAAGLRQGAAARSEIPCVAGRPWPGAILPGRLYADDLAADLALKPDDSCTVLWLYLARLRTGQAARERLREDAARFDRGNWPWPIVAVLLGDGDAATVLADVRRSTADDKIIRQ